MGACKKGIQSCVDGNWGECEGDIGKQDELCDGRGIDEDCDGYADTDDTECECVNDTSIPCRLSAFQGDCALGHRRCVDGTLQACEALNKPQQERCGRADPDAFGRATGDEDCDGKFDESSGPLPPLGCKIYHLDEDEDTWGAIGPSFLENPQKATHGCFCGLPPAHLNEFVPALPDRHNRDCGDCLFTGKRVNPAQERFFTSPSTCLIELEIRWAGGFYDYNCDGVRELQHEGSRKGTCLGDPVAGVSCHWSEDTTGFWAGGDTPGCGEKGAELICSANGSSDGKSCWPGTAIRSHDETTQGCR